LPLEKTVESPYLYQNTFQMITYQVQLPESNQEAFSNIIQSLQSLGVISSFFVSESMVQPGSPVPVDNLLEILSSAEKQAESGASITSHQVVEFMKSWRERK
jgi:hypothetical protein